MSAAVDLQVAKARRELFGTQVHALGMKEVLAWTRDRIASRTPGYVVTLNGALLVLAARDPSLRALVNDAALVTADGIGVVGAARILGVDLAERVAGIDLSVALCGQAEAEGHRVFLLGGRPGVAEEAAGELCRGFPRLVIAGTHHGYFGPDEEEGVCACVREGRPDLLFVAFGAPLQERWMRKWSAVLGVPVSVGVGGSLDVLAGRVPRAPAWAQRAGLEWLWRVLREPRRWRVVRTIPPLFLMALRERLRRR